MDYSPSGSSVHGIFQARYWSGLLFPTPGDLPHPGTEPAFLASPALAGMLERSISKVFPTQSKLGKNLVSVPLTCTVFYNQLPTLYCDKICKVANLRKVRFT